MSSTTERVAWNTEQRPGPGAVGSFVGAALEREVQVAPAGLQRGHDPGQQRGDQHRQRGEEQGARVDDDGVAGAVEERGASAAAPHWAMTRPTAHRSAPAPAFGQELAGQPGAGYA